MSKKKDQVEEVPQITKPKLCRCGWDAEYEGVTEVMCGRCAGAILSMNPEANIRPLVEKPNEH